MKRLNKIILITGVFLSTSLWADMDKMCYIYKSKFDDGNLSRENTGYIRNQCERNNILVVHHINSFYLSTLTSGYCRADRNVNVIKVDSPDGDKYILDCVLYDNKPREVIVSD